MAGSWRAVSFTELCVIRAHQFVSGRMRSHCILSAAENTQCRTKCGVLFQTTLLDGKRSWHIFRTYRRFCLTLRKGGGGRLPILRNSCVLQDSSHNSEMFLAALVSMPFSFHYKLCQFIFLTSLISATYETHFLLFKKKNSFAFYSWLRGWTTVVCFPIRVIFLLAIMSPTSTGLLGLSCSVKHHALKTHGK